MQLLEIIRNKIQLPSLFKRFSKTHSSAHNLQRPQAKYYLALILKEKEIKAIVWQDEGGQVSLYDTGIVYTQESVDSIDSEQLLVSVDQAIGIAEKNLPQNIKTTHCIFGLEEWWIKDNVIAPHYMTKLKTICKELELKPLGFVVLTEALSHVLKREEGVSPNAFLVLLGFDAITVSLIRHGVVEKTATLAKNGVTETELTATIIQSFGDLDIKPHRFLLYDGAISAEEARNEFVNFDWQERLGFMHMPKVDVLPKDLDMLAVVSGAAKEMGLSFGSDEQREAEHVIEASEQENEVENVEVPKEGDFGFLVNEDIAKHAEEQAKPEETTEEVTSKAQTESDEELPQDDGEPQYAVPMGYAREHVEPTKTQQMPHQQPHPSPKVKLPSFALPAFKLPSFGKGSPFDMVGKNHKLWLITGGILVALVLIVVGLLYIQKATVTLYVDAKVVEKDINVIVDPKASAIDAASKTIPGQAVDSDQVGDKTGKATGQQTIGDKAKGEVTIYNKTENTKTFQKGTVLNGPNGLQFTLDSDVTVASSEAFSVTPQSVKAQVTAAQIGDESNLSANTNLPFKDYPTSSYFAKNDNAFAGGTKKTVTVVSKEDQDNLLKSVLDDLAAKAKDDLQTKSQGLKVVDSSMAQNVTEKKFSKQVGDQTENFSVSVKATFTTLAYKESDLNDVIASDLGSDIPSGYEVQKDQTAMDIKNVQKDKSGKATVTLHATIHLVPTLDLDAIRKNITGKSRTAVETYLSALQTQSIDIQQNIKLPKPFDLLPLKSNNITIEVKTQ